MNPARSLTSARSESDAREQQVGLDALPLEPQFNTLRNDAHVIGLIGVAHATSHFFHLILAPLFPWLKNYYGFSYAQLGLLMTVFFLVSSIGQALAGFIVDRVGAYPVHLIGLGLLTLSALGLASSQNYAMLVTFEAIAGLGNSVFHPSGFTILNKRVSVKRLGHAFSMHGVAGTLGWAAAPLVLAGVATLSNWRVALLTAAILALAVLVLLALNRKTLETAKPMSHSNACLADAGSAENPLAFLSIIGLMGLPGIWMCFAFFFINAMANGGIQSFAPAALHDIYGLPVAWASMCITAYMLASAGGMVWGGFLAAKSRQHEKIIAGAFAASGMMAMFVASGVAPASVTIVLLACIGLGSGIAGPSRDLLVRAACPCNATGRVYGMVYSGLDIGLSIAPLLFGGLMDRNRPRWVFILIGAFQTMAIVTALKIGSKPKQGGLASHGTA
jgi:FSR family fosmidomycin resistance protein-like MFS transporter